MMVLATPTDLKGRVDFLGEHMPTVRLIDLWPHDAPHPQSSPDGDGPLDPEDCGRGDE